MKQDNYKGAMKYTPTFSIADEKAFKAGLNSYNKEIRKIEKESIKWLEEDQDMLQEILLLQKAGLAHTPR